jgi:hypothetical protein
MLVSRTGYVSVVEILVRRTIPTLVGQGKLLSVYVFPSVSPSKDLRSHVSGIARDTCPPSQGDVIFQAVPFRDDHVRV